jgi:hypothetical protein
MLTATWSGVHLAAAITALAPANDVSPKPESAPIVTSRFRSGGGACQALLFEPPSRKAAPSEPRAAPIERAPRTRPRVVPERENGSVVGIRLFGIGKDGWLGVLGLENGDRIDKVNGFEIGTPERALQAYARLRTESHLRVELVRRGRPMTIDYYVR